MTRPNSVGLLAALTTFACATPERVPLDAEAARHALMERATQEVSLEQSLAADLPGSLLVTPTPAACATPDQHGYWYLRAAAWAPEVRAQRRALGAAQMASKSAGAPGAIAVQVIDPDLQGDDGVLNALAAFDLVGLLGLGPSAAEQGLAQAQVEAARAGLEDAAWRAWLESERALVVWRAAARRRDRLTQFSEQAGADMRRALLLDEAGRVGASTLESAAGATGELERRASLASDGVTRARARLAAVVGVDPEAALPQGAPQTTPPVFLGGDAPERWFMSHEHLEAHPRLRMARRAFEVREQEVRQAAARAWPGVSLGPRLGFVDPTELGGVLRITVPFPSSWRGLLAAATERRDGAIEAYEDELHLLQTSERDALSRVTEATARARGASQEVVRSLVEEWEAARAGFQVQRTPLKEWTGSLRRLSMRATWDIDDDERRDLAALDLVASRGPMASPLFMGASQ